MKDYPSKIFVLVDKDGIPVSRPRLTMEDAEAAKRELRGFAVEILEYDLNTDVHLANIFEGAEQLF